MLGELPTWEPIRQNEEIDRMAAEATAAGGKALDFNEIYILSLAELEELAKKADLPIPGVPTRRILLRELLKHQRTKEKPIKIVGILDLLENEHGILVYTPDNFRLRGMSCFFPQKLIDRWGLNAATKSKSGRTRHAMARAVRSPSRSSASMAARRKTLPTLFRSPN